MNEQWVGSDSPDFINLECWMQFRASKDKKRWNKASIGPRG